jgi:hypothetical protein
MKHILSLSLLISIIYGSEKFNIPYLEIKESALDCEPNFKKYEAPFFYVNDKNETIAGTLSFNNGTVFGSVIMSQGLINIKPVFDCNTKKERFKPDSIKREGELETEISAIIINRCLYYEK